MPFWRTHFIGECVLKEEVSYWRACLVGVHGMFRLYIYLLYGDEM